jgi:hypothetical protein
MNASIQKCRFTYITRPAYSLEDSKTPEPNNMRIYVTLTRGDSYNAVSRYLREFSCFSVMYSCAMSMNRSITYSKLLYYLYYKIEESGMPNSVLLNILPRKWTRVFVWSETPCPHY